MSNANKLVGNWQGVEPKLKLEGTGYHFDLKLPFTISLQITEEGKSSGSQRFLEMGSMPNNDAISFKTSVSDFQLMFRGKLDGRKRMVSFVYMLLDPDTLLLSTDGGPMSQAYGDFTFANSYDQLVIDAQQCMHRYQPDAPFHCSQTQYIVQENHESYGTYWELAYEAKNSLGLVRTDRAWYFPEQQMLLKPIRYLLKRQPV